MKTTRNKGFTLIETIVYLAIFAIIMTGTISSVYAIFSSSARNQTKALTQEEGSFLLAKIDWALTGTQTINQPNDGNPSTVDYGNTLSVTKFDSSAGNPIVIAVTGGVMTISRAGNPAVVLNNTNTTITCPVSPEDCFKHTSASGDGINPEGLTAKFRIHATTSDGLPFSQDFTTVKYLRR